ncbi:alanine--glyoxylate aminotransferase family protein [Hahella sp. SMD15-11]|uniref:Alanine--glyoxylate aminotransferase family protein n=1 Tax=Thermohahella caldifontis TaxID=3142973 RepID=A0AB39UUZ2_9GAMM
MSPKETVSEPLEYSVVYTSRALNHMSPRFQQVMRDISRTLKEVYQGHAVAIVPGGGTFGMEAIARQFATDERCLILRNGWFSYRWTQILEQGKIARESHVLKARPLSAEVDAAWIPAPVEEVEAAIETHRPAVVFAPHVETASGIRLPDDYVRRVGEATRRVGGLFVLDCVASGTDWVDMKAQSVDVLLSAPQKGWSSSPGAALIVLSERAEARLGDTTSTSFAADLKRWRQIMAAYEAGGHAYHATMPTDALARFRDAMLETGSHGWDEIRSRQHEVGACVRSMLARHGFRSVAADGFGAPGVVVCHTSDPAMQSGQAFLSVGIQAAAGVPLMCDEPEGFSTFRIGLFGLDKLSDPQGTAERLEAALRKLESGSR